MLRFSTEKQLQESVPWHYVLVNADMTSRETFIFENKSYLRRHYFNPLAGICVTSHIFFYIWPQAITFSWEQKKTYSEFIFLHISYELVYIFCVYVFESCTFFCWCWFDCFACKVNISSLCAGELKNWLCFVSKLSLFLPSFSDKTASFCSVQTFTLASGLQENLVSLWLVWI